jgi:hypothetical protein
MRRVSRKTKPADTRQFDLFAAGQQEPVASNDLGAEPPASHLPPPVSHEARVLEAIVSMLTRQWSESCQGADRAARSRSYR